MKAKNPSLHHHHHNHHHPAYDEDEDEEEERGFREANEIKPSTLPEWNLNQASRYIENVPGRTLIIVGKYFVEISADFLDEHPGGANVLLSYSISPNGGQKAVGLRNATWAFYGGLNNHTRGARNRLKEMRVARVALGSEDCE
jgi:cytochrome b involved in lipid metabolism